MKGIRFFNQKKIATAVSAALIPVTGGFFIPLAHGQEATETTIETISVTATRRAGTVQDVPLNISAIPADLMEQQNIEDLDDVARWVPGLTVTDQGGRENSPIIVRGLNTNSSGPGSDGGTVSTYVGEIPLFINMRLIDIERVEVLIGPQGTLYGAGTLGGAIRYIPVPVDLDFVSGEIFGGLSSTKESDSIGGEGGFIFNAPLIDGKLGVRMSLNYQDKPGFIDYNYLVRDPGVSLPDPDWSNPGEVAENIYGVKDAHGEERLTGRIALRYKPTDWLDGTLTYYYQKQDIEGRSISHYGTLAETHPLSGIVGKYESAYRYQEPMERTNDLLSLELKADFGFAELVSATGFSNTKTDGQRDQTDLLIRLSYGYEEFPSFAAYTRDVSETDNFTQELRLVSKGDGALSWIVGGYYNKYENDNNSKEFTPGFDQFAIDVWGASGQLRPDSIEYYSIGFSEQKEIAIFGELNYQITDKWDVTVGLRRYEYEIDTSSARDLPLYRTVFGTREPDAFVFSFTDLHNEDSGTLFKFNTSYKITDDLMVYGTISEGFRMGGANSAAACPADVASSTSQQLCALPDEQAYLPDTTTNYELGFKSTWLKNRLHFNAAIFNVDWDDAQVSGVTTYGSLGITTNAEGANARGVEISTRAILTDSISAYATYSYTRAKLTADAPGLFMNGDIDKMLAADPPIFADPQAVRDHYEGKNGDRLPGSAEHQFSLGVVYSTEVWNKDLDITYGLTAQSDTYSTLGLRANGEVIPGYALSNMSAKLAEDKWSVTFYIDNLFDKYGHTSVRRDKGDIGYATFPELNSNGYADLQRNYGYYLLTPRTVGLKFNYKFGL